MFPHVAGNAFQPQSGGGSMPNSQYNVKGGLGSERGQETVTYVVQSGFGTKERFLVTLILLNRGTNNGFYEKHVLRLGDDSRDTLDLRQNIDNVDTARLGEAIERYGVLQKAKNPAIAEKVTIKTAPASTMLRLDKIDLKLAVYTIANAFLDAMFEDHFGDYRKDATSGNHDLQVTFPSVCVEQRDREGGVSMGKTMTIGGSRKTKLAGDPGTVTFDVNHCTGP